jgi:hypothetical protein
MDSAVNGLLPVAVRVAEVVIGAVGSAWLVAKATKAHSISVAKDIADNQTKVDAGLEGVVAQAATPAKRKTSRIDWFIYIKTKSSEPQTKSSHQIQKSN